MKINYFLIFVFKCIVFSPMKNRNIYLSLFVGLLLLCSACSSRKVYLSTSFHEPATDGLRFIYSYDGYHWDSIPGIWLEPAVGTQRVLRDPSLVQASDGVFHLVWTSSWRDDYGIGYASSRDLVHWSEQRHIDLMQDYDTLTHNVWAPELFYESATGEYMIAWASAIPGRFDGTQRQYYTVTRDFKNFSLVRIFYDPGYNSIDGTVIKRGENDYVLIVKDNRKPGFSNLHAAFGTSPAGPWRDETVAFTPEWAEGPTCIRVGEDYLIYFDLYRQYRYGAVRTRDFRHFEDITERISVPKGHKHGTAIVVDESVVERLLQEAKRK